VSMPNRHEAGTAPTPPIRLSNAADAGSESLSLPIAIRGATKRYGDFTALGGVDLDIADGEFFTLLGPSGSGKTTLLMVMAGFVTADAGSVRFGDRDVVTLPAHRRDVGVVFQNYALFPHMSVAENVDYPLKLRHVARAERSRRVEEALRLVHMETLGRRRVTELSGGQRQRVALARAFVYRPRILLMDEPLSALDKNLRERMQIEIKRLHRLLGMTTVYVTHDQREAMTMSDRIAVMRDGRIVQVGTPRQVYDRPCDSFVAQFIGESSLIDVTLRDGRVQVADRPLPLPAPSRLRDGPAKLVLRPEKLQLEEQPQAADDEVSLPCVVGEAFDQGETFLVSLSLVDGQPATVRTVASRAAMDRVPRRGSQAWLRFHRDDLVVVPADGTVAAT